MSDSTRSKANICMVHFLTSGVLPDLDLSQMDGYSPWGYVRGNAVAGLKASFHVQVEIKYFV